MGGSNKALHDEYSSSGYDTEKNKSKRIGNKRNSLPGLKQVDSAKVQFTNYSESVLSVPEEYPTIVTEQEDPNSPRSNNFQLKFQ